MADSEYPSYDEPTLLKLRKELMDVCIASGHVMRSAPEVIGKDYTANMSPTTLFPTPFPKECFELSYEIQSHFNLLYYKAAHDRKFLEKCFESALDGDEFTRRLWGIYQKSEASTTKQPLSLCISRSDYMLSGGSGGAGSAEGPSLKQVEYNTISSGMAYLPEVCRGVHKYMLGLIGEEDRIPRLPESVSNSVAGPMVEAWKAYGNPRAAIFMATMKQEANFMDIRRVCYAIRNLNPSVPIVLDSFTNITVDGDGLAHCDGQEIALVYFRDAYSPRHYTSEQIWQTREAIELSKAIKCPSIQFHLVGMKKVQQELAAPGVLERYLGDEEAVRKVRSTFVQLQSLEGEEGKALMAKVKASPKGYVLKPNREGGGNNVYEEDIPAQLDLIEQEGSQAAYIIMDLIRPVVSRNLLVFPQELPPPSTSSSSGLQDTVNELGVFGAIFCSPMEVFANKTGGYLFRAKSDSDREGGIMVMSACLDTPCLY